MKYVIAQGNPFDWEQPVRLTGTFNSIRECDEYAQLYSLTNYWAVPVDSPGSLWVDADADAAVEE